MRFSIIPICLTLVGVATAQLQFSSPKSGVENEFSQTWFEGDTMDIAWYGDWRGTGDGADVVDLWVTWFTNPAFSQLILPNIKMGDDGTTTWKINVTNAIAKEDNRFVLRLKPHTSPAKYTDTLNQASGVGITIQPSSNQESSSQSSSASSTLSTATSTKATSATTSATATTTPPPATDDTTENTTVKKKTSIGPIVGGVLGGLIVLILLLVIALLVLRKKKRSNNVAKDASELAAGDALIAPQYGGHEVKYAHNQPSAGGYVAPAELADTHETRPGQGFAHELPAAAPGDGGDWRR